MKASYFKYILDFARPSGTSRGILTQKETWFIVISDSDRSGIGECGLLRGLSIDDRPDYEQHLQWACDHITMDPDKLWEALIEFPSIQFGVEMALHSFKSTDPFVLFPSAFTTGADSIQINGLIWMGDSGYMQQQIRGKIDQGFKCVKMKIGAINFDQELQLLSQIRENYTPEQIELRVDANGAFDTTDALYKISQLAELKIHSIEQPIAKNQHDTMAALCKSTTIPIALDEELIGVLDYDKKEELLRKIMPQYIILKPSFIGGFRGTLQWINLAEKYNIGWWMTSALESNVGLNAIAQWTFTLNNSLPQGLGTGGLFLNNIDCPLQVDQGALKYNAEIGWNTNGIFI